MAYLTTSCHAGDIRKIEATRTHPQKPPSIWLHFEDGPGAMSLTIADAERLLERLPAEIEKARAFESAPREETAS